MKFFDEIQVIPHNEIEKQVFDTINEIVSKINEVQFIGVADLIQFANDAVRKIDKDNKHAVEADLSVLRGVIQGLREKTDIENDLKIRNGLVDLVQNRQRFEKAMENIIFQGSGEFLEKKAMNDKLQAFLDAQELYQGYGALSPRDLTLAIQMIETAIETIANFVKAYATKLQANNTEQLKNLQHKMLTARANLLACAMDLLELNKKEYVQSRIVLSDTNDTSPNMDGSFIVVPQMAESFINISPVEKSELDLAQYWIQLLNDIIKGSKSNPKLMHMPQIFQRLDENIPANPFLFDDDNNKAEAITIRQYLSSYVLKHASSHPVVMDMVKRRVLLPELQMPTLWTKLGKIFEGIFAYTPSIMEWKAKITASLNNYYINYFPTYYKADENQTSNIPAKPFITQVYHKIQDTMDVIWVNLGYQPATENVIRRYHDHTDSIANKYKNKKEEKSKKSDTNPVKKVVTVGEDNHTIVQEADIEDIDAIMKEKYPQPSVSPIQQVKKIDEDTKSERIKQKNERLQKQYDLAVEQYSKAYNKLAQHDNEPSMNIVARQGEKSEPTQDDIIELQQRTNAQLLRVSHNAVSIRLKREFGSNWKERSNKIAADIKPFLVCENQNINFANLFKDTMALCLSYSDKLVKPAPQRVQAINWLYEVMHKLNTSQASEIDKFEALVFALHKVAVESHLNHRKTSPLGFFDLTKSVLNEKITQLLDVHRVENIKLDALKQLQISGYEDFVSAKPAMNPVS